MCIRSSCARNRPVSMYRFYLSNAENSHYGAVLCRSIIHVKQSQKSIFSSLRSSTWTAFSEVGMASYTPGRPLYDRELKHQNFEL